MVAECINDKDNTQVCESCYEHSKFNKLKGSVDIGNGMPSIIFPIKADSKNTCAFLNSSCKSNSCDGMATGATKSCNNILYNIHGAITGGDKTTDMIIDDLTSYGTDDKSKSVILTNTLKKLICDISVAGIDDTNLPGAGTHTIGSAKVEYDWYYLNNLGISNTITSGKNGKNYNNSTELITFIIAMCITLLLIGLQIRDWIPNKSGGSWVLFGTFIMLLIAVIITMALTLWTSEISSATEDVKDLDDEEGNTPVKPDPVAPSNVMSKMLMYTCIIAIVSIIVIGFQKGFSLYLLLIIPILFLNLTTYFSYFYAPKLMLFLTFLLIIGELLQMQSSVNKKISESVLNLIIIGVIWFVFLQIKLV